MNVIVDDWGIDDVVIAEIERQTYNEGMALTWWMAMLGAAKSCDTMLDLGSYTGLYSLVAAKCRPDTRVIAVEASVITYGRLVQNVLSNHFDQLVVPNHYALSRGPGIVQLGHGFGVTAMASGESLVAAYPTDHFTSVVAISLDDLLLQDREAALGPIGSRSLDVLPIQGIGGVKLDVEGVEVDVLSGATGILHQFRPPLVVEILDEVKQQQCNEILQPLGYELIAECPGSNFVFCTTDKKDQLRGAHEDVLRSGTRKFETMTRIAYDL